MTNSNDEKETHQMIASADEEDEDTTSAGAAGIVRGLARSIQRSGRAMARLPSIGRLPRHANLPKTKLPVRTVANLSDRMSTSLDVLTTAVESTESGIISEKPKRMVQLKNFASSLVKNTILGAAVFETYSFMISTLTPPNHHHDDNDDSSSLDDYARATLGAHYVAGGSAGCVHSFALAVLEYNAATTPKLLPASTLHHGIAHSLLFGSYETMKRSLLQQLQENDNDDRTRLIGGVTHEGADYLGSVAMAGGLAGQIQHITSHYTEQWLLLAGDEGAPLQAARGLARFTAAVPPTLRSTLLAFPPSAIGFVAFEYGRSVLS